MANVVAERWRRLPGLPVAAALLMAWSGCAARLPWRPIPPPAAGAYALLWVPTSECPEPLIVRDVASGTELERAAPEIVGPERLPPRKTLQSAYDDYLQRRRAAADTDVEMTVLPEPTPGATPIAYRLPLGPRRLQVAEGAFTVNGALIVPASGNPYAAVAVLGVGLLLFAADVATRRAPVDIDVTVAAEQNYLLHCDAEHAPWAWVTVDEGISAGDFR